MCDSGDQLHDAAACYSKEPRRSTSRRDVRRLLHGAVAGCSNARRWIQVIFLLYTAAVDSAVCLTPRSKHHPSSSSRLEAKGTRKLVQTISRAPSFKIKC
ncbi:hypothetical protein EJB05_49632 [Eragrostis curvula]|uniref:Uncharacterized protein n=1 Tax=Eragrostis curvula TaxID=38414 RepID=A0A5J9T4R4_9POAL|nr:hypothetical protein EJB05_49632 [Eragrostis curvula]